MSRDMRVVLPVPCSALGEVQGVCHDDVACKALNCRQPSSRVDAISLPAGAVRPRCGTTRARVTSVRARDRAARERSWSNDRAVGHSLLPGTNAHWNDQGEYYYLS